MGDFLLFIVLLGFLIFLYCYYEWQKNQGYEPFSFGAMCASVFFWGLFVFGFLFLDQTLLAKITGIIMIIISVLIIWFMFNFNQKLTNSITQAILMTIWQLGAVITIILIVVPIYLSRD